MSKFQVDKVEENAKRILERGEQKTDELITKASQAATKSNHTMWYVLGGLAAIGAIGLLLINS